MCSVKPKVLLIVPKSRYEFKDFPLGINYIRSSVHELCPNVGCEVIDLNKTNDLKQVLYDIRPHIIGISVSMPLTNEALNLAHFCRSLLPNSLLVAGGPQPTIQPEVFLHVFDLVVRGEGEIIFSEIVNMWPNDNYHSIDGVFNQTTGQRQISQHLENQVDIDALPKPSRVKMNQYDDYIFEGEIVAPVIGSRGCPYSCIFCAKEIFGYTIRHRSIPKIIEELIDIKYTTGISCFQFRDDIFTLDSNRVKEFGNQLMDTDSKLMWLCNTRASLLDNELIEHMALTGCKRISIGIETASDEILALLQKQETLETMRQVTESCHDSNIKIKHYYMVGIPNQTMHDITNTVKFIRNTQPDEIYCSIFLPYPGSRAWTMKDSMGFRYLFDIDKFSSWEDAYYQSNADYREAPSPIETDTMNSLQIMEARDMIWAAYKECHG